MNVEGGVLTFLFFYKIGEQKGRTGPVLGNGITGRVLIKVIFVQAPWSGDEDY
jgi:hypothetical protein